MNAMAKAAGVEYDEVFRSNSIPGIFSLQWICSVWRCCKRLVTYIAGEFLIMQLAGVCRSMLLL